MTGRGRWKTNTKLTSCFVLNTMIPFYNAFGPFVLQGCYRSIIEIWFPDQSFKRLQPIIVCYPCFFSVRLLSLRARSRLWERFNCSTLHSLIAFCAALNWWTKALSCSIRQSHVSTSVCASWVLLSSNQSISGHTLTCHFGFEGADNLISNTELWP